MVEDLITQANKIGGVSIGWRKHGGVAKSLETQRCQRCPAQFYAYIDQIHDQEFNIHRINWKIKVVGGPISKNYVTMIFHVMINAHGALPLSDH